MSASASSGRGGREDRRRKPCQIYVSQKISLLFFSLLQKKYRLSKPWNGKISGCKYTVSSAVAMQ